MANVSHRRAIKAIGGAALTTGLTLTGAAAQERTTTPPTATAFGGARATPAAAADAPPSTYLFFNKEEAAFIEPAVARLIPADEKWGGALEAGVPNYMDKQLVVHGARANGCTAAVHGSKARQARAFNGCLVAAALFVYAGGSALAARMAEVDAARLTKADQDAANWLSYGRTYSEQRFSPLARITADNAKELGLAWYADFDINRGQEATPLIIDGVMYVSTA
jgi:hypothetical protein